MSRARTPLPRVGGFDFTGAMRALCDDIVARLPELSHVDFSQVAVACCQTRRPGKYGLYATLTPMRFEGGSLTTTRHGRPFKSQKLCDDAGREMLYILRFYLPRFMDVDFHEKLATVIHELWHISPEFNGDLRRHEGRCFVHSRSHKQFDARIGSLAEDYLTRSPPKQLCAFLHCSFRELKHRYGAVYGAKIPHPKLIPIG